MITYIHPVETVDDLPVDVEPDTACWVKGEDDLYIFMPPDGWQPFSELAKKEAEEMPETQ